MESSRSASVSTRDGGISELVLFVVAVAVVLLSVDCLFCILVWCSFNCDTSQGCFNAVVVVVQVVVYML